MVVRWEGDEGWGGGVVGWWGCGVVGWWGGGVVGCSGVRMVGCSGGGAQRTSRPSTAPPTTSLGYEPCRLPRSPSLLALSSAAISTAVQALPVRTLPVHLQISHHRARAGRHHRVAHELTMRTDPSLGYKNIDGLAARRIAPPRSAVARGRVTVRLGLGLGSGSGLGLGLG